MTTRTWTWWWLGGLAVALAAGLGLQRQHVRQLKAEIALLREERREIERLRIEHERLSAAQPTAEEWQRLRDSQAERIRCEIELAKFAAKQVAIRPSDNGVATVAEQPIPATTWSNAGRATPEAVLETALWAAAGGEVDALADTLLLEPDARAQAEALLAGLSPPMRASYGTAERLVALLTAREVPLGAMQFIARMERASGDVLLRVRLQRPDGSALTKSLAARGTPGDWRLVVPASAVRRFEAMLRAPASAATP